MVILASCVYAVISVNASPATRTIIRNPISDSYVDSKPERHDENYGGLEKLEVYYWKTSWMIDAEKRFAYLMFDLSDFPTEINIRSAHLKLFAKELEKTLHIAVHYCSDNSWTETEITWSNKPQWTIESTDTLAAATPNSWYSWDVTTDVRNTLQTTDKFLTLVLIPDETDNLDTTARFYSKEAPEDFKPSLEITYDKIQPELELDPVGGRKLHETIRFTGSLSPAWPNVTITLTFTDPDEETIEKITKTDSQGRYQIDFTVKKKGIWKVIATSESNQFFEESTSDEKSFPVEVDLMSLIWIFILDNWWWLVPLLAVILYILYKLITES